jgi:arylsulfatase A-like enzyme/Flp pilus assembly protein TadD
MLAAGQGSAQGMDVVLVTLDTTRADHVGCYGRSPSNTPTLDRLCAAGRRFDNAVTSSPVTLPAHASIMTGLLPNHHGARYNGEFRLGPDAPVLAEELRSAGYQTAAFVSSFVLERRFGLDRGFDIYDDHVEAISSRRGIVSRNERDAGSVTDAALAFLRGRKPGKPVFLWVHYYDAHAPYAPVEQPESAGNDAAYSGEIGDVDHALGRLLATPELDSTRTVVIVTADHGEGLGEHDERTHGLFLYGSTTQVPLIVALPDSLGGGGQEPALAALIDIRPSLLSLLGIGPHGPADGIDWLTKRRQSDQGIYQEASLPYFDYGFAPLYGLRAQDGHYIEAPTPEFYDLETDPRELVNLASSGSSRADRFRQRLDAQMLDTPDIAEAARQVPPVDSETLARLRSLGYLGDAALLRGETLRDPKSQIEAVNLHQDAAFDIDSGNPSQALRRLVVANQISPRNLSVLRLMAKAQLQLGDTAAAEKTLAELLAIRKNPDSLVLLAQMRILQDDFATAERLLSEAEQLDSNSGGVHVARGDIAKRRGDRVAAEREYRQAADLDPDRLGTVIRGRLRDLQRIRDEP